MMKLTLFCLLLAAALASATCQDASNNASNITKLPLIKTSYGAKNLLFVSEYFPSYLASKAVNLIPDIPDAITLHTREHVLNYLDLKFSKPLTFFSVLNPPRSTYKRILIYVQEEGSDILYEYACSLSLNEERADSLKCELPVTYPNLPGIKRILTQEQVISTVIERIDVASGKQYLDIAVQNMTNITGTLVNDLSDPSKVCRDIGFLHFDQFFYCATKDGSAVYTYQIFTDGRPPIVKSKETAKEHFSVDVIDFFTLNVAGDPVVKSGRQVSIYQSGIQTNISSPFNDSDYLVKVLGDQSLIFVSPDAQQIVQYRYGGSTPVFNGSYDLMNCSISDDESTYKVSSNLLFYAACHRPDGDYMLVYDPQSAYSNTPIVLISAQPLKHLNALSELSFYLFAEFNGPMTADLLFLMEEDKLVVSRIHIKPFIEINYANLDFHALTKSDILEFGFELTSHDYFDATTLQEYEGSVRTIYPQLPLESVDTKEPKKLSLHRQGSNMVGEFAGYDYFRGTLLGVQAQSNNNHNASVRNTSQLIGAEDLNMTGTDQLHVLNQIILSKHDKGLVLVLSSSQDGKTTLLSVYDFSLSLTQNISIKSLTLHKKITGLSNQCTDVFGAILDYDHMLNSSYALVSCANGDLSAFDIYAIKLSSGKVIWRTQVPGELNLNPQINAQVSFETGSLIVFSSYLFNDNAAAISVYRFIEGSSKDPYIKIPFSAIKGEVPHMNLMPTGSTYVVNNISQSFELMFISTFDGVVYCTSSLHGNGSDARCSSHNITDKVLQDFSFSYRPLWKDIKMTSISAQGKYFSGATFMVAPENGNSYLMQVGQQTGSAELAASSFQFKIVKSFNSFTPELKTSSIAYVDDDWLVNSYLVMAGESVSGVFDLSNSSLLNSFQSFDVSKPKYRILDALSLHTYIQINGFYSPKLHFKKTKRR